MLDQHRLSMRYESWQGVRDWAVDPLGLVLKAGVWYLAARGAGKVRVFRVSNIQSLAVGDTGFEPPVDFHLAGWWQAEQARFEAELFATGATVRASPEGCKRLAAQSPRGAAAVASAEAPDAEGWRRMTMMVEDADHGARDMLALGAEVEVVAPASFRDRIATLAREIVARHG
ncbi:MAG: WYL domain-containing protein [Sphingopyxis sp.]|nr:WYL domain-containing protein [Sphingopyxis sp.]